MRRTIQIAVPLLVAVAVMPAAGASASTLLSGYGGPGQGNQAILGSALLHGPKGSGGSHGGGSGSSAQGGNAAGGGSASAESSAGATAPGSGSSATGSGSTPAGSGAAPAGSGSAGSSHTGGGASDGKGGGAGTHSGGGAAPSQSQANGRTPSATASFYPAVERIPAGQSSDPLGVSGSELVYIIVALAVLALAGALMRRLARAEPVGPRG